MALVGQYFGVITLISIIFLVTQQSKLSQINYMPGTMQWPTTDH